MASNDIKQKIVLEGEKEYNRALSEAKRNLKTLRSELKAETAELGANATAQQKNETRIKSLQKQIKEQEKVVKTYEAALKEVKDKYGDNEDAIAKWEQKLNDARYSLANMRNELEGVGNSFKDVQGSADMATVATKSVADTFGKLSDIGGTISDGIESAFKGLLSTAKDAVEAIWGDIVNLAAKSNDLVDLAGFWNTDVMTIQKYAGAVQEISGSLEDLSSLVTKINAGDSDKIAELTGVSKVNYRDQWKYAMAVMDALNKMPTTKARNNAAFEIFGGKQATKAFDLLNDWQTLLDNLDKYNAEKGGYGLSKEELNNMSDLYDKVNGLKASWQSLKEMAEVRLVGQLSMDLTSNAQALMDAFLGYLNAESDEERNEALKNIEKNIMEMFETAKKAIEDGVKLLDKIAEDLKASDNPTAQALGNILSGLVDALKWFTEDNMNNVVHALEILAAFWLTGKGLQMGTKIAEILANLKLIQGYSTANTAVNAANGAAAGSTAGTAGIGMAGVGGLMGLTAIGAGFVWAADRRRNHAEEVRGTDENLEKIVQDSGLKDAFTEYVAANKALQDLLNGLDYDDEKAGELYQKVDEAKKVLDLLEGSGDLLQAYSDWRQEHSYGNLDWLLPDSGWWQTQTNNGGNAGNTDGLTAVDAQNMTSAVQQMPNAVAKGISGIRVNLDGQTVGRLVAPYVSQQIAREIQ